LAVPHLVRQLLLVCWLRLSFFLSNRYCTISVLSPSPVLRNTAYPIRVPKSTIDPIRNINVPLCCPRLAAITLEATRLSQFPSRAPTFLFFIHVATTDTSLCPLYLASYPFGPPWLRKTKSHRMNTAICTRRQTNTEACIRKFSGMSRVLGRDLSDSLSLASFWHQSGPE
jgi:hypothetical protein